EYPISASRSRAPPGGRAGLRSQAAGRRPAPRGAGRQPPRGKPGVAGHDHLRHRRRERRPQAPRRRLGHLDRHPAHPAGGGGDRPLAALHRGPHRQRAHREQLRPVRAAGAARHHHHPAPSRPL
ncbi:MAG: hypothetical protein AVDCRST_MAG89-1853, partial [uncultured Gemmatimonadetes bacterium]